jgi:hypothetical protein
VERLRGRHRSAARHANLAMPPQQVEKSMACTEDAAGSCAHYVQINTLGVPQRCADSIVREQLATCALHGILLSDDVQAGCG